MGFAYRITEQQGLYFVTATVHQWVDVFTRPIYTDILLDSFHFAQEQRGLQVYAWVVMTNHFHAILSCNEGFELSNVLRDMKKFTASQIVNAIRNNSQESRRSWLQWLLKNEAGGVKFWAAGNHPEEIWSQKFFLQKLEYIHNNPVKAGIVARAEDYRYSSALATVSPL
jgi:REP element-mobilizing transposase RayT